MGLLLGGCGFVGVEPEPFEPSSTSLGGADAGVGGGTSAGGSTSGGASSGGAGTGGTGGAGIDPDGLLALERAWVVHTFEDGAVPAGEVVVGSGDIDVVAGGFRGGFGLRATVDGEAGARALLWNPLPAGAGERIHFRGWVFVPAGTVTGLAKLVGLGIPGAFGGPPDPVYSISLLDDGEVDLYEHPTVERWVSGAGALAEGAWRCIEVDTFVDDQFGFVEVQVQSELGQPVELAVRFDGDTDHGPITSVSFGVPWTERAQGTTEILWDDVVIGPERVPCDLPLR